MPDSETSRLYNAIDRLIDQLGATKLELAELRVEVRHLSDRLHAVEEMQRSFVDTRLEPVLRRLQTVEQTIGHAQGFLAGASWTTRLLFVAAPAAFGGIAGLLATWVARVQP